MFEREDDAGQADTGKVEQSHLDRGEWVGGGEEDKNNGKDRGVDSLGEEERGGTLEVVDGLAAFGDDARDGSEIRAKQYELGRATSGVGAFADGDRAVGFFHGEDVVDAIAGHGDGFSLFFEGEN